MFMSCHRCIAIVRVDSISVQSDTYRPSQLVCSVSLVEPRDDTLVNMSLPIILSLKDDTLFTVLRRIEG